MADDIVAPGVQRVVFAWAGDMRYYGTFDALAGAGLIEPSCPLPGSQPGKRGVRWRDAQGRRHVLAKFSRSELMLTIYATAQDRRAAQNEKRREQIKTELAALCIEEEAWRDALIHMACAGLVVAAKMAFRENAEGVRNAGWQGPYSLSEATRDQLSEHYEAICSLLREAPVHRDESRIQALKRERATLEDKGLQSFLARVVN